MRFVSIRERSSGRLFGVRASMHDCPYSLQLAVRYAHRNAARTAGRNNNQKKIKDIYLIENIH